MPIKFNPAKNRFFVKFRNRLLDISDKRPPDFIVGPRERPYLRRWFLVPRNPLFNIYLHHFCRDDDDRALHDHPWHSLSLVLLNGYFEITPKGRTFRDSGELIFRSAKHAHRIEIMQAGESTCRAWTLFITGPRIREWGFHCPRGWVHWRDFTAPGDKGQIGKGCG